PHRLEWSFVPFYAHKCIFVHIPKAAGIAISQSLFNNLGGGHETIQYYQEILKPSDFEHFYKFTIVRNPWDRLHSAYEYLKSGGFGPNDKTWFLNNLSTFKNFEDFVLNWLSKENSNAYIHFNPQVNFLKDQHGKINFDLIGRYETLSDDVDQIKQRLNIPHKLQNKNVNLKKRNYQEAYTKKMIEKVESVYSDDVKIFNYKFQ
ncbi:MAG: sulfotransferase family 2 domain-containing protein, partial [Reichenbachiella sp.]